MLPGNSGEVGEQKRTYDKKFLLKVQGSVPKDAVLIVRNVYNGFVQPVQYSLISGPKESAIFPGSPESSSGNNLHSSCSYAAGKDLRAVTRLSAAETALPEESGKGSSKGNLKMSSNARAGGPGAGNKNSAPTSSENASPATNTPSQLASPGHHHLSSPQPSPLSPKVIGRKGRTPKPPDLEITLTTLEDRRGVKRRTFLDQNGMVVDDSQGVFSDIFDAQKDGINLCKLWKSSISKNGALLDVWRDQDGNVFHDAGGSLDMIFESVKQVNNAARKKAPRAAWGQAFLGQSGDFPQSGGAASSHSHSLSGHRSGSRGRGQASAPESMSSYQGGYTDNSTVSLKTAPAAPTPPGILNPTALSGPAGMDPAGNPIFAPDGMSMYYDPYLNAYVMPQPMPGYSIPPAFPLHPMSDLSYSGSAYGVPPPSEASHPRHRQHQAQLSSSPSGAASGLASSSKRKSEQVGPETMNQRRGSLYKALTAMKQGQRSSHHDNNDPEEGAKEAATSSSNSTSRGGGAVRSSPKFRRRGRGDPLPGQEAPDPEMQAKISQMHKDAYEKAIENCEGEGCTMMLKNIPNKYTREMLVRRLEEDFKTLINFLYMPIDFVTECNVGYCFINFRTENAANAFKQTYNQWHTKKVLPGYNSNKIAEVSAAAVQGLYLNLERLKRSPLLPMLKANEAWQPVLFDKDGAMFPFPCETDKHWARRPGEAEPRSKKAAASAATASSRSSVGAPVSPPPGISPPASAAARGNSYYDGAMPMSGVGDYGSDGYVLIPDPGFYDPAQLGTAAQQVGTLTMASPSLSPQISIEATAHPSTTGHYNEYGLFNERMESGSAVPPAGQQSPLSRSVSNVSNAPSPTLVSDNIRGIEADPKFGFKKAELSPKQQKLSDDMKIQVTRAQIEHYFSASCGNTPQAGAKKSKEPALESEKEIDDRALLRRAMDEEGWIPITALMSLKGMYYPGHDLMRDCIRQSRLLEMNEGRDKFRCRDVHARNEFLARFLAESNLKLLKSK